MPDPRLRDTSASVVTLDWGTKRSPLFAIANRRQDGSVPLSIVDSLYNNQNSRVFFQACRMKLEKGG